MLSPKRKGRPPNPPSLQTRSKTARTYNNRNHTAIRQQSARDTNFQWTSKSSYTPTTKWNTDRHPYLYRKTARVQWSQCNWSGDGWCLDEVKRRIKWGDVEDCTTQEIRDICLRPGQKDNIGSLEDWSETNVPDFLGGAVFHIALFYPYFNLVQTPSVTTPVILTLLYSSFFLF